MSPGGDCDELKTYTLERSGMMHRWCTVQVQRCVPGFYKSPLLTLLFYNFQTPVVSCIPRWKSFYSAKIGRPTVYSWIPENPGQQADVQGCWYMSGCNSPPVVILDSHSKDACGGWQDFEKRSGEDKSFNIDEFIWPHGFTLPLSHVRKRRFRKRDNRRISVPLIFIFL